MNPIDIACLVVYFAIVIGLGFYYRKRAAADLSAYFLGGNRMHWLGLAMSGSVSNFDITGTMWIISILYVLGMKSMWHHWMWGFLMGAFFLSYMGKWVRRSGVMTAAEWMKTRFGDGPGGRLARTAYAIMAVLAQAGFIGYAFQGIGKFAAVYIPLEQLAAYTTAPWLQSLLTVYEPHVLAAAVIGITTLYVVLGGLFSVVVTDVIQTVILTLGSVFIALLAWSRLDAATMARVPDGWASLSVPWTTGVEGFELFGAMVLVWVVKGLLLNAGGPGQMYDFQRFLSARDPRDAAKVGAAWSVFLVVRWAMAAGIALLAVTGIAGAADPERVMPVILIDLLPVGIRGVVIAGLLAAFMSTFSSTVNSGASFIVRDIWQAYIRPDAGEREAVRFSYCATVLLVAAGVGIGFAAESIAAIWNWLMMALGAGVIVPNVLRWYWWRINGWGYAAGMFGGILLSLIVFPPLLPLWERLGFTVPVYVSFPAITGASLLASVAVTRLTRPVNRRVLVSFYNAVGPFGAWGPVRREPDAVGPGDAGAGPASRILLNCLLGMVAVATLYLAPMYLVGHWYRAAGLCGAAGLAAIVVLKFTWYDKL